MRTCFGQAASSPHAAQNQDLLAALAPVAGTGPTPAQTSRHTAGTAAAPQEAQAQDPATRVRLRTSSFLTSFPSDPLLQQEQYPKPRCMQARLCYSWHGHTCLCTALSKWRRPSSGKAEAAAALSILFLSGNTSHAGGSCFPSCFIT